MASLHATTISPALAARPTSNVSPDAVPVVSLTMADDGIAVAVVGTGFCVVRYDPAPCAILRRRDFGRTLTLAVVLRRTNVFALVFGGHRPPPGMRNNVVVLWDEAKGEMIGELKCSHPVSAVHLTASRAFVAMEGEVRVFHLCTQQLLHAFTTADNALGVYALSTAGGNFTCAFPGIRHGVVQVASSVDVDVDGQEGPAPDSTTNPPSSLVPTCAVLDVFGEQRIASLALSPDGRKLAVASREGRSIRVYSDMKLLRDHWRGGEYVRVYAMAFSPDGKYLAVASDRPTIHIFDTEGGGGRDGRSVARFAGTGEPTLLAFVSSGDSTPSSRPLFYLMLLGATGRWERLRFDTKACSLTSVECTNLVFPQESNQAA